MIITIAIIIGIIYIMVKILPYIVEQNNNDIHNDSRKGSFYEVSNRKESEQYFVCYMGFYSVNMPIYIDNKRIKGKNEHNNERKHDNKKMS